MRSAGPFSRGALWVGEGGCVLTLGDIRLSFGDTTERSVGGLTRSASLSSFDEVARTAALDPSALLREFDLPQRCLTEPELRIPVDSVRRLLEAAADRSGVEAFGLRMAHARRLSDLGPLGLLMREQPTLRLALEACANYANRLNAALHFTIEESSNVVILREDLILGR